MFGKNKNQSIVPTEPSKALSTVPAKGSILAMGGNTAMTMLSAELVLICDRSGSMDTADAMHGRKRYEIEDQVVADLQAEFPGRIIVEAFADTAILCLNGELPYPDGGATVMSTAFELAAKLLKRNMKAILITDGEATDSEDRVLRAAKPLIGRLDIVYVGSDRGAGRGFLERLAQETAGTFQRNKLDNPKLLESTIKQLYLKSGGK